MGHVMQLRVGHLSDVAREIVRPTLNSDECDVFDPEVLRLWPRYQALVAEALQQREPMVAGDDVAAYLRAVVETKSQPIGDILLSAATLPGLTRELSMYFGLQGVAECAEHLASRPLGMLSTAAPPYLGWLRHFELEVLMAELEASSDQTGDMVSALSEVRDAGFDLMSVIVEHRVVDLAASVGAASAAM